jgi:hypothetical protein
MSRPIMTAVAAQQAVIDDQRRRLEIQERQIALIARLAGVSDEVNALARTADISNPAQPVPDPGEQGPSETTEQAAASETNDDVRSPGQTGNSAQGVPAATTDVAVQPGGTLPAEPYGNLQDVTAPVSGTNTGEVGGDQTRIESDVRVGNPMVPDVAFPWTVSPNQSNSAPPADGEMGHARSAARLLASIRLAKLRIEARLARGDELSMGAVIDADPGMSDSAISHEISVLSQVTRRSVPVAPSGKTVPRRAATRTAPSLAGSPSLSTTASADDDSSLFLSDGDFTGL